MAGLGVEGEEAKVRVTHSGVVNQPEGLLSRTCPRLHRVKATIEPHIQQEPKPFLKFKET